MNRFHHRGHAANRQPTARTTPKNTAKRIVGKSIHPPAGPARRCYRWCRARSRDPPRPPGHTGAMGDEPRDDRPPPGLAADLEGATEAHRRLLRALSDLSDADARRPSRLSGWTVAHV